MVADLKTRIEELAMERSIVLTPNGSALLLDFMDMKYSASILTPNEFDKLADDVLTSWCLH